ncbi:LuxR C-terminal-related transcriptional regulator [Colwelliaceae bacterium BS250]
MQKNVLPIKPLKHLTRKDLITSIDNALVNENKSLLIKAPAGYGKTYLLIDYAYHIQDAQKKLLWSRLTSDDNSPEYFFTYFLKALKDTGLISDKLYFDENISLLRFINNLVTELETLDENIYLFFNDFQCINNSVVVDFFQHLILNTSSKIKVLVASRVALPFPTSKAFITQKIHQIGVQELAFNIDDIKQLACDVYHTAIDDDDVQALLAKTNGWPAIISLELNTGNLSFNQGFKNNNVIESNKDLTQYFYEEVISTLSEQHLNSLLILSISNYLCADLSYELTADKEFFNDYFLKTIPIIALDDPLLPSKYDWYTIQPILKSFLRQKFYALDTLEQQQLNLRTAQWFLKKDVYIEAVEHFILAKDFQQAITILEDKGINIIASGNFPRFAKLISHLPNDLLISKVNVLALTGWFYALNYQHSSANSVLVSIEQIISKNPNANNAGAIEQMVALRASNAAFSDSQYKFEAELDQSFNSRPLTVPYAENSQRDLKCFTYLHQDKFEELDQQMNESLFFAQGGALFYSTIIVNVCFAMKEFVLGRLSSCIEICQSIEKFISKQAHETQLYHLVNVVKGMVAYVQGDLDSALAYFDGSGHQVRYLSEPSFLAWYYACHIQLLTELNDQEARELLIEELLELNASRKLTFSTSPVVYEALDNFLYLNHDDDAIALHEQYKSLMQSYTGPKSQHLIFDETMVDSLMLIRQGELEQVTKSLADLIHQYEKSGRVLQQLKCLITLVNVYVQKEQFSHAKLTLKKAISVAYKKNIIQYFSRLGEKAIHYLQDWSLTELSPKRKAFMVDVCARFDGFKPNSQQPVVQIEPLTTAENKIMELLSEGHSNKDIADKLYLSINTVKTHLKTIYVKLGASNRIQATRLFNQINFS